MDLFIVALFKLFKMTYILNYSSILYTSKKSKTRFGGSSKYRVMDDELIPIETRRATEPKREKKKEINLVMSSNYEQGEIEFIKGEKKESEKKVFRLNKSKVKKKCYAFSRLEKSKKFMAFYTITYPFHLPDETCYKLFNTWLTRCRRKVNLHSYLWVAERQKNGTIHFHLLTNDYMPIKEVNGFMASALTTEKKKGIEVLKTVDTAIYNGIDVRKVGENKKSLIGYIAKYVSKNNIEFHRLPWHCSRDVSRLFTSIHFVDMEEEDKYFNQLPESLENYTEIVRHEYFNAAGFKFTPDEKIFEDINGVNELIYNSENK